MGRKFYNSVQWGIQKENLSSLREDGLKFLEKISCKTGKNYSLDIRTAIKEPEKIDEIFGDNLAFIVLLEPSDKSLKKIGQMSVTNKQALYKMINDIPPELFSKYTISIIEQIMETEQSFVGTALSDGKGKLFIEFLNGTTNSKYLTSTGADVERLDVCAFSDFETISQFPKKIPIELVKKVKDSCHFFKGYYEFVYGSSKDDRDIFFTFYSDIEDYLNLLKTNDEFDRSEITERLKYRYTTRKCYFGECGQIKEDEER